MSAKKNLPKKTPKKMPGQRKRRKRRRPAIIMVCVNWRSDKSMCCSGKGSEHMARLIEERVAVQNLGIVVERSVCLGYCVRGMNVRILGGPIFHHFKQTDMDALFAAALEEASPVGQAGQIGQAGQAGS